MNHQQELINVFGFSLEDLERNRKGELTEAQAKSLSRANKMYLVIQLTVGLIMALVGQFNAALSPTVDILLTWGGLGFMLYAVLRYRAARRLQVKSVTEVPTFIYVTVSKLGDKREYMLIDRVRFPVSEQQSMRVRAGNFYTAYFVDGGMGQRLLSIEPAQQTCS